MSAIDDYEFDCPCPNCNANNPTKLTLVKTSPIVTCPKCGATFQISARHYAREIATIEGAIKNLGV